MRRNIGIGLFLVVAIAAVYWPVSRAEFVNLDDDRYVTENPHVQRGLTWAGAEWAFTTVAQSNWHPLTWLSHMADWQLFGSWAGGHHLVSVGFHAASGILLFLILARMTRRRWPSAVVAALFLVHPLHVESVAWVAERKDVLSTFFGMLTLGAYALYVERPSVGRYAAAFVLLALGLLAKPMLVTLPFVLLLLDFWPLGRLKGVGDAAGQASAADFWPRPFPWRRAGWLVLEKVPLLALVAAASVVAYVAQERGGAMLPSESLPLSVRKANALVSYVGYLGMMVWPRGLAVPYPYVFPIPPWQVQCAEAALVIVTALVLWQRRRPYLAVGWFWYVGMLVPVVGLVQQGNQTLADRYTYVPLIGIFVAITWLAADGLAKWGRRARRLTAAMAGVVVLAACAAVSANQVRYWSDSVTLLRHILNVTANNTVAHDLLGAALAERGQTDEAIRHFQEVLRTWPDYMPALNNMAWVLATCPDPKVRDGAEAVRLAERACELTGRKNPSLLDTLAAAYAETGRFDDAVRTAEEALSLALADDKKPLADAIGTHLELYRSGRPWHEGRPGPGAESR
jgi:protein O-mannosyl-transferase